jgi:hypothetical protein
MSVYIDILMDDFQKGDILELRKHTLKFRDALEPEEWRRALDLCRGVEDWSKEYLNSLDPTAFSHMFELHLKGMPQEERRRTIQDLLDHIGYKQVSEEAIEKSRFMN